MALAGLVGLAPHKTLTGAFLFYDDCIILPNSLLEIAGPIDPLLDPRLM